MFIMSLHCVFFFLIKCDTFNIYPFDFFNSNSLNLNLPPSLQAHIIGYLLNIYDPMYICCSDVAILYLCVVSFNGHGAIDKNV